MLSAPGCWAVYGSILAWYAELPGRAAADADRSQQIVDAYAVQHATNPDRRNRQSVAVHLMSLCTAREHGISGARLRQLLGSWTHRDYPQLAPRPSAYPITIREVIHAPDESRLAVIDEWAISSWASWSAHHATVRAWVAAEIGRANQH
jgi:hypothetical protein